MAAKTKLVSVILFLCVLAFWIVTTQFSFVRDVRSVFASDVESIEICDIRKSVGPGGCQIFDGTSERKLASIIVPFSRATASLPPGKATIAYEGIVRLRLRGPSRTAFDRCYRLIEYVGFDHAYLNQIVADRQCQHIQKYGSGYATMPKLGITRA